MLVIGIYAVMFSKFFTSMRIICEVYGMALRNGTGTTSPSAKIIPFAI
jgi:hypothetical protein